MSEPLFHRGNSVRIKAGGRFVTRERFVPNLSARDKVLIAYVLGNFDRWFISKVEEPSSEVTLEWRELQRNASNPLILRELGDPSNAETTLAAAFALMEQQRAGQIGVLANNGWGNIFYVRDIAGELRAVNIHWCDDGWGVEAMGIGGITEWPIRDRVFVPVSA